MPKSKVRKPKKSLARGTKPGKFKTIKSAKRYYTRNVLRFVMYYTSNIVVKQTFVNAVTFIGGKP